MRVEVFGHSEDLIVLDGDKCEEFGAYNAAKYLHFGDGTVLEVEYSPDDDKDYRWRIIPQIVAAGTELTELEGTYHGEEEGAKCDKLVLVGDLKRVDCYSSVDGPTDDDIAYFFENLDWMSFTPDQSKRIMEIAKEPTP
jgi:hypothetical protein